MNESDFLYGCHSGIQKAVRRGDLDLAATCFDAMWADPKHRSWLKWRTAVLVEEDAWQMTGELAKFLRSVKGLSGPAEEKAWRKFIYQVTLAEKSKDSEALFLMAEEFPAKESEHPELEEMRFWLNVSKEPTSLVGQINDRIVSGAYGRKLSDYEKAAISTLTRRVFAGGMYADRMSMLSTMILVAMRGLSEEKAEAGIKAGVARWKEETGRSKPRPVNLGWYVFDSHTYVGKMALSVFMKNKAARFPGLTQDQLDWIWFSFESARCHPKLINWVPLGSKESLSAVDTMWWLEYIKFKMPFGEYNAKQVKELWDKQLRPEVKSIVNWCIDKRRKKA